MSVRSNNRRSYTLEEEKKILQYICDKKAYEFLKGRRFWQDMEEDKVVSRTWQSVSEHFRTFMVKNLYKYPDLTEVQKKMLRRSAAKKGTESKQQKPGRPKKVAEEEERHHSISDFSDSSDENEV